MSTTLFYRLLSAPAGITKPSGVQGGWNQSDSTMVATNCQQLNVVAGSAQDGTLKNNWSSILHGQNSIMCCYQAASSALAAQTISSGTWQLGFALSISNATANQIWTPFCVIALMNGSTGGLRTTIFALAALTGAASGRSGTGELTCFSSTLSGGAATASNGDYLLIEAGFRGNDTNISGSWVPSSTIYMDGTTVISSDNVVTSSAKSFVLCPTTLTFQGTGGILGPALLDGLGGSYFGNRVAKFDESRHHKFCKRHRRVYVDLGVSA